MVDLRQTISQDLIRFHVIRDCDRRCGYLLTNGICRQYTSLISREKECCATFPNPRMIAITAAALNRGIKATRQCQTFCFHYRDLHFARIRASKSSPSPTSLLNLLINKQVLIAKQMSQYVFFREEVKTQS